MKSVSKFIKNNLEWLIVASTGLLCLVFLLCGNVSENGSITLDGNNAKIEDYTYEFIEDANEAIARVMNNDVPTDGDTIEANDEPMGQGFYVDINTILSRILPDGDDDNGKKWQCSKYTAYLGTGKREYSTSHTDYGPVNGKDVAAYLVKNYGFKYIDKPVKGAIGSGGWNTTYGHTAVYLYSTGANTAMVNDANYKPLVVSTHNMNISGWVWVVPGNYEEKIEPTPEPTPSPVSVDRYKVVKGDTLGGITINLHWCDGCKLYGDDGYTQKLAEKNNIPNRGLIYPGQIIEKY